MNVTRFFYYKDIENKWNRGSQTMNFFKWSLVTLSVLGVVSLSVLFYAFKIEPYQVHVNEYISRKNEEAGTEIRVIQFSDVHVKEDFDYQNLAKVVKKINQEKPDFVIFTGDLYDNYSVYNDDENIINELNKIEATYGKIAIWGNRDYGGGAGHHYAEIVQKAGFMLLSNQSEVFITQENKKILFTGLDDSLLGSPMEEVSENLPEADYAIFLMHEPDFINLNNLESYNLILAGHSHGGQIHIPFIPELNKSGLIYYSHSETYRQGFYDLKKKGDKKIYVNGGIGTTHISARLGTPPEITLFRILL